MGRVATGMREGGHIIAASATLTRADGKPSVVHVASVMATPSRGTKPLSLASRNHSANCQEGQKTK
jgi:hypothetical protein